MTSKDQQKAIAIVGGGMAGTYTLIHTLLKIADDKTISPASPVKLLMVERTPEQLYGGIAYSKGAAYTHHNLNAGARSLSMFPANNVPAGFPTFVDYIQEQAKEKNDPSILHHLTDPSRQLVNDYMKHVLDLAIAKAGPKAQVEIDKRNIVDIEEKLGGGATLRCEDGKVVEAAHVVLATGFQQSLSPKFARTVESNPHFVGLPYSSQANAAYDALCAAPEATNTLIIGTGLTAMDIAARLINSGYKGQITMMSRRGLMHKTFEPTSPEEYLQKRIRGESRPESELEFTKHRPESLKAETLPEFAKAVVQEFRDLTAQGYTSGEILAYWERFVPEAVAKFPQKDVAQLLAQNEVLITTLRAGVTPDTGITIRNGIESGQIKVATGAIKNVQANDGGGLVATYVPTDENPTLNRVSFSAAANREVTATYDYVFSAMGNSTSFDPANEDIRDPLWAKLMATGKATPHWTKAGVEVAGDFSLMDKDGHASSTISVIGVPVTGHMTVTAYPFPDKPGTTGKLGPTALNSGAIMSTVLNLLAAKYDAFVAPAKVLGGGGADGIRNGPTGGAKRKMPLPQTLGL